VPPTRIAADFSDLRGVKSLCAYNVFLNYLSRSGCNSLAANQIDVMPTLIPLRPRPTANTQSSLVIHNIVVGRHRTSVRLEPMMWDALQDIAQRLRQTMNDLVTNIDRERTASSLTAAIRMYIVDFYRAAALSAGQPQAVQPSRLPI
jgi:predicted DNA-binding ribbon-helix-helix protein